MKQAARIKVTVAGETGLFVWFVVCLVALGVYFVGGLNDWAWYVLAVPWLFAGVAFWHVLGFTGWFRR